MNRNPHAVPFRKSALTGASHLYEVERRARHCERPLHPHLRTAAPGIWYSPCHPCDRTPGNWSLHVQACDLRDFRCMGR